MASLRIRQRSNGTPIPRCCRCRNGKQSSSSFNDHAEAVRFQELANKTSPAKALETGETETPAAPTPSRLLVGAPTMLDHLTGVNEGNPYLVSALHCQ